jgi:serine protease Do
MLETQRIIGLVAEQVGPAVVGLGSGSRGGAGVVLGPGQVATLARNLRGEEVRMHFLDGREAAARVLGIDPDLDLALLSVDTGGIAPAEWAPDGPVRIGTAVLALANRAGGTLRVTSGFVSTAGRRLRGRRGRPIDDVIEHTAPLPRGSGGGPITDVDGRLLGLNAVRVDGGLILALPAAALRERIAAIADGRSAPARRLGVAIVPARAARGMRRAVGLPEHDGLLVRAVAAASPAALAGVRSGDLIVVAGGREIEGIDDLYAALDAAADELELRVLRGTDESRLTAALGPAPESTGDTE